MLKWDRQPRELPKHQTDRPKDNFREGNIVKKNVQKVQTIMGYTMFFKYLFRACMPCGFDFRMDRKR